MKREARKFSLALKIFRRFSRGHRESGESTGAIRDRRDQSAAKKCATLCARRRKHCDLIDHAIGAESVDAIARAADALEKFQTPTQGTFAKVAATNCPRPRRVTFSFSRTSRSILIRPRKFSRWANRNGIARSHSKPTNANAIATLPPLKFADNLDAWIKEAAAKEVQVREFLETAQNPRPCRIGCNITPCDRCRNTCTR